MSNSSQLRVSCALPVEMAQRYIRLYDTPVGYRALKGTESIVQDWHDLVPDVRNRLDDKITVTEQMVAHAANPEKKHANRR